MNYLLYLMLKQNSFVFAICYFFLFRHLTKMVIELLWGLHPPSPPHLLHCAIAASLIHSIKAKRKTFFLSLKFSFIYVRSKVWLRFFYYLLLLTIIFFKLSIVSLLFLILRVLSKSIQKTDFF